MSVNRVSFGTGSPRGGGHGTFCYSLITGRPCSNKRYVPTPAEKLFNKCFFGVIGLSVLGLLLFGNKIREHIQADKNQDRPAVQSTGNTEQPAEVGKVLDVKQ